MVALVDHVDAELGRLAPGASRLVAAVSGGPDSVALLRLLHELAVSHGVELHVAHFDHALREASADDARFVATLADELSVPYHAERVDIASVAQRRAWNLEDAGRRLRYDFLTRTARSVGAEAVATGHTMDDQAETVLMQLLRGAAYLKGMPPRRGLLVRPLLKVARRALEKYLKAMGQPFIVDSSNLDISLTRAWVRHEVMARLEERLPQVARTIARSADLQRDLADYMDLRANGLLGDIGAPLARLKGAHPALQRQVIATLISRAGAPVDMSHVERVREALDAEPPTRVSLPHNFVARIAYAELQVVRLDSGTVESEPARELPPEVDPGRAAEFRELVYRARSKGDRIVLPGGTKKVSHLLIDRKIPREERDSLRVLASGPDVLWIEGVATDVRVARELNDLDASFMVRALELAREAGKAGEVPIGAVVARDGEVIGSGANEAECSKDPTRHAEMLAIREAAARLGDWRLEGCTLYVTLEPCPMCLGAMLCAHLTRIVYGASNRREGALGSVANLLDAPWKRDIEVRGGVLAQEAGALLGEFFADARKSSAER